MINTNDKITLNKHFGFSAFHTTPVNLENTQNIALLSSIKPSMCIPARSPANQPKNYDKNPSYSINCYKNAISVLIGSFLKCI
jgi:hypothetical protein